MQRVQKLTPTKTILLGYCFIILLGTLLLLLPAATRPTASTSFLDALFTATSATCVTGLVRFDTFAHWTLFGQSVILALIQIGGIGFMTFAISLVSLTKRKIGLSQRFIMQQSVAAPHVGGIVRLTKFILWGTLLVEGLGTLLLSFTFCPLLGFWRGLYFSLFHAVSAFCNAGFDLMGVRQELSSLTGMSGDFYVNIVIMALIVIGGLGFFVWSDVLQCRFRLKELKLHTKLVLTVTLLLIVLGAALIFVFEQGGSAFAGRPVSEQALIAAFQSVSPRTAGFNTVDLSAMTQASQMLMICLMFIGGSPGSTAGGVKTTTVSMLFLSVLSTFRQKKSLTCYRRRIDDETMRTAACVFTMYGVLVLAATLLIAKVEALPIHTVLFETVSAIGTVGLSLGVTPQLGALSQLTIILLMIFGRVGSITILFAFASEHPVVQSQMPLEKVQIG